MITDTTFLSDLLKEFRKGKPGSARGFLAKHREAVRTTIISVGELAVFFPQSHEAWQWLCRWKIYGLHRGVAEVAADIERQLKRTGDRLGENDNWIAGFCAYYREPIISHDAAFDRVPGVRRIVYER